MITIIIILVLLFVPIIPFKSLGVYDRYHGGSGNIACYPNMYSVYGLIQLYNQRTGMVFSPNGGTYHVTWHFLSCYDPHNSYGVVNDKDWPMPTGA